MKGYRKDLAYIHDRGFSSLSLQAASGLTALFKRFGLQEKTVVDLGCGSGRMAAGLRRRGYAVTGIDYSPSMIALARENVPGGEFRSGSLWNCTLPRCDAVVSVGEAFTSFRRWKGVYRRSTEDHKVRRMKRGMVLSCLHDTGFRTYTLKGYTDESLGNYHLLIVGKKLN